MIRKLLGTRRATGCSQNTPSGILQEELKCQHEIIPSTDLARKPLAGR